MLPAMRRERLRDAAFIAAIAIVLVFVSVTMWQKSVTCSNRGGEFAVYGRGWTECRFPDGTIEHL
jgi:hypothetical protein